LEALLQAERLAAAGQRAALLARIAVLEKERDKLRASHERLREELELFKRRLFVAKAERVDTRQLELEYAQKLSELDTLAGTLELAKSLPQLPSEEKASDGKRRGQRAHNSGTGRRDLSALPLEEKRIEISDPHLETLVLQGKVVRHGFEETYKIAHERGGKRRVVIARVRYKTVDADGNTDVITTAMPEEMLPGAIATPSLAAHVIMENIGKGLPLFRIEDTFKREGLPIDRGTLSRWKKRVGDHLTETVVAAMCEHAVATAFCIATDATGVCVQPIPDDPSNRVRRPCKKAHFLVRVADRDHVIFDYLERETSTAIYGRFAGFNGYVQADAKSVFNLLFADAASVEAVSGSGKQLSANTRLGAKG
jgi:transposase